MLNLYACHSGFHSLISQMVSVRVFVYVFLCVRIRITNSIRFRRFSCCRLLFKCLYVVFWQRFSMLLGFHRHHHPSVRNIIEKDEKFQVFFLLHHFSQIKHFNSNFNFSLKFSPSLNSNETRRKIETAPSHKSKCKSCDHCDCKRLEVLFKRFHVKCCICWQAPAHANRHF